ncbi:glycosyltransferase [Hanstruepera ponticola]|uniref:glycosyltransferase n=1 Tax=Hanstruepera ponticola TaxID=2042995 RepID=UPI00177F2086|nr:glycosyltransferase [Hanstruepera ponticola]
MKHKKRIRVLYTIPNFNTAGSGRSVYDLVKGLDKTIFEPEICCFHNKGTFFKEVESLGVPIHLFPFTTAYRPWTTFFFRTQRIKQFFKRQAYDVIHSWHWSSDFSEALAAKMAGIPYVYTKKAMGWESRFWKWKSFLSSSVIVVNQDMMVKYFSKMHDKAVKFPLAIDTKTFVPMPASVPLRNQLGIEADDFVIVSVANLVPVKGIEDLIEAALILNESRIKVLIVGDHNNDYGLKLKARYQKDEAITFIGKQLDVKPYLALANLFVIPTKDEGRREGIPNAPLEAMAMERIVLGSDVSGIHDILEPFPSCLFQAGDVKALSYKIQAIKGMSQEDKVDLAQKMRLRVVDVFSIEDFLNNHQSLYLKLVG